MKRLILVVDAPDDFGTETLGDAATWLECLDSRVSATAYANAEDAAFDERIKNGAFEMPATNLPRLIEVPDLETPRMLVLSTAHISEGTAMRLDRKVKDLLSLNERALLPVVYEKGEYGFLLPLISEDHDRELWSTISDLAVIRKLAEANGCNWIMLDQDGDTIDALPTYDW